MTTTLKDVESEGVSNCCGAKVIDPANTGIEGTCSDCKEPCGIVFGDNEETEPDMPPVGEDDDPGPGSMIGGADNW